MIDDFKMYSVSDEYIDFLRMRYPNVYSNKEIQRTHTRKYIGIVLRIGVFCYYVPLSSPKRSDYQQAGGQQVIKKSIVPITRIVVRNSQGNKELKGTLRISHMIPVPESELESYDLEHEQDLAYKDLVQDEILFIRRNKVKIKNNVKLMYKQKQEGSRAEGYVKSALDFKALEKRCMEYIAAKAADRGQADKNMTGT